MDGGDISHVVCFCILDHTVSYNILRVLSVYCYINTTATLHPLFSYLTCYFGLFTTATTAVSKM